MRFFLSEAAERKAYTKAYADGFARGAGWVYASQPEAEGELVVAGHGSLMSKQEHIAGVEVLENGNLKYTHYKTPSGGIGITVEIGAPYWSSYYFIAWKPFGISRHVVHNTKGITK